MAEIDSVTFKQYYSDDSGVERSIGFDRKPTADDGSPGVITFTDVSQTVDFPVSELDWTINCLQKIKRELVEPDA